MPNATAEARQRYSAGAETGPVGLPPNQEAPVLREIQAPPRTSEESGKPEVAMDDVTGAPMGYEGLSGPLAILVISWSGRQVSCVDLTVKGCVEAMPNP